MIKHQTLENILTSEQELIYEAALELGSASIQELSKKSELPRTSCYSIIEQLQELQLVEVEIDEKTDRKTIIARSPSLLQDILKQKQAQLEVSNTVLETQLPRLEGLYKAFDTRPDIQYHSELAGIKTILDATLATKQLSIHCSGLEPPLTAELDQLVHQEYYPKLSKKNIAVREILTQNYGSTHFKHDTSTHQVKINQNYPGISHVDKFIFDDKVAIIAFDLTNGVIIEHPMIASFEQANFNQIWEMLG
jgi:sugar-specific transcriptional regulator TrmB